MGGSCAFSVEPVPILIYQGEELLNSERLIV